MAVGAFLLGTAVAGNRKPGKTTVVNAGPNYRGYDQVTVTTRLKKYKPTEAQKRKKAAMAKKRAKARKANRKLDSMIWG